jgi:1-acyl-sn-glycerol-3-phosphate acyltransferase
LNLRATLRLAGAVGMLLIGLLTVTLVYPLCGNRQRLGLKQRWSKALLRTLGISMKASGVIPQRGLLVSNHISFIDIFAINAVMPASFVSKDEVRRWPLIGWLAMKTDTIFMERGSRSAAQKTRENLAGHLRNGTRVALFPEGTTSRGEGVLPFHGALLQSAIDAGIEVIPVTVRYLDAGGQRSEAAAYVDDMSLVGCMQTIASSRGMSVSVDILPSLASVNTDRRHLASAAHRAISHHLAHTPDHDSGPGARA